MSSVLPDDLPVAADVRAQGVAYEVDEFLSWMATERGRSANTLAAYRRDLIGYCSWIEAQHCSLPAVDRGQLDRFVQARRASGAAAARARRDSFLAEKSGTRTSILTFGVNLRISWMVRTK